MTPPRAWTHLALAALAITAVESRAAVDYLRDIKPLLAGHCTKCHGASQQKGGLRLDTGTSARHGGEKGAAIRPGQSTASLLVQVVEGTHPDLARMPYKKPPLDAREIALLKTWIDQGAPSPADEVPDTAQHWAFIPPSRVEPPPVQQKDWVRNPIDQFILARQEKEGIKPAPEADRVTLIRRLSLDLIGLPPTMAEVDAFLGDHRPDAWERLVDRLLASPHYGERWGRHWLDVARYADSHGYSIDAPRQIWKYRDWVINAFNCDLPFDQFVIEQLAGDLLPDATMEQKIATGFHRNTQINEEGGIDKEQFRIESVIDRVNTTGTAFLGLTIGCAQCHDHKFDPITQKEFYRLFAFLNNADEPTLEITGERAAGEEVQQRLKELEDDLDRYIDAANGPQRAWEQGLSDEQKAKLKADTRKALATDASARTKKQKRLLYGAFRADDPEFKKRQTQLMALEKKEGQWVTTLVMAERKEPRESYVFIKGDFTRHGEIVQPGVPAILPPLPRTEKPNRLDLARWIVSTNNPLTARVTVNRVWQQYFGKGLVETENDFGTQGAVPTHPELLDWLALEFMEGRLQTPDPKPWSLKRLHRLITTSATYRQSSRARPDLLDRDANNRLLARQSRLRLDAEVVRDAIVSVSGLLNEKVGGPSVFPPQPDGVMKLGQSKRDWTASSGPDRHRRGLYTHYWRATPHPALAVFDAPDAFSACTRRLRSNTPLQALTLLNDRQFYELAQAFAARLLREGPAADTARLEYAFRLATARRPAADETQRLQRLLDAERGQSRDRLKASESEAWTAIARVLLNLDETITRE